MFMPGLVLYMLDIYVVFHACRETASDHRIKLIKVHLNLSFPFFLFGPKLRPIRIK